MRTVRRAYKQKALETHPDKLDPGSSDEEKQAAKAQFYKVAYVYATEPGATNSVSPPGPGGSRGPQ